MRKISNYIFLLLKNTFIISVVSLLLALLGGEASFFRNFFNNISFYAAFIAIFLAFIHTVLLILSFIVKNLKYIYLLLKYTFIMSAISLLLTWLGGESSFGNFFGDISIYGTLISVFLFGIHLVGLILSSVLKNNSKT
jgi:hypothetical protein